MDGVLSELPLAVFTTLMPIAAGVMAAYALIVQRGESAGLAARWDKMSVVTLVLAGAGFVGAFFHLGSPLNAPYALRGIGRSPLSTEIAIASVFVALVLALFVLQATGRSSGTVRKGLLLTTAAWGFVLAVGTGLVYYVVTIPTWATVWPAVEQIGYLLVGTGIGLWAHQRFVGDVPQSTESAIARTMTAGAVVAVVALALHLVQVSGMSSVTLRGADLVVASVPFAVCGSALLAVAALLVWRAVRRSSSGRLWSLVPLLVIAGVFLGRLSFYCLQMNVGM